MLSVISFPLPDGFHKDPIPAYSHYENLIETLRRLEPPLDKRSIEILNERLDEIPYAFSEMFIDGFRMGKEHGKIFR